MRVRAVSAHRRAVVRPGVAWRPWDRSRDRFPLILALLAALLWQNFVIDTHVDFDAQRRSAVVQGTAASLVTASFVSAASRSSDRPADCPICFDARQAGAYVSSADVSFPTPIVSIYWSLFSSLSDLTGQARSHAWLGRGPPLRART